MHTAWVIKSPLGCKAIHVKFSITHSQCLRQHFPVRRAFKCSTARRAADSTFGWGLYAVQQLAVICHEQQAAGVLVKAAHCRQEGLPATKPVVQAAHGSSKGQQSSQ